MTLAIGIFEGHMRKMGDGFASLRRAELLLSGAYDATTHGPELAALTWQQFSDDEFALCPPIVAMGGDGAMLDIVREAVEGTIASIPRKRRQEGEMVREAVRRAVRAAVSQAWGKRPIVKVLLTRPVG